MENMEYTLTKKFDDQTEAKKEVDSIRELFSIQSETYDGDGKCTITIDGDDEDSWSYVSCDKNLTDYIKALFRGKDKNKGQAETTDDKNGKEKNEP